MRKSLVLAVLVLSAGLALASRATDAPSCCAGLAACKGADPCKVCTDCSRCKHCKDGGTCGVCAK